MAFYILFGIFTIGNCTTGVLGSNIAPYWNRYDLILFFLHKFEDLVWKPTKNKSLQVRQLENRREGYIVDSYFIVFLEQNYMFAKLV
jgi:hypothetical protein